ncbi:hypothetical protein N658DRAFT_331255 [Parathielavia hyrcaniae]|uniref:Uncharacterized protein n=1 Tax=Parathielavia hyrcaniae TaxID=113614 RepID=A0AAN6Q3M6_9PEZI|nr:hypothetical protein N658DRAFT_331255 [Parathielavia hyrcaniae]
MFFTMEPSTPRFQYGSLFGSAVLCPLTGHLFCALPSLPTKLRRAAVDFQIFLPVPRFRLGSKIGSDLEHRHSALRQDFAVDKSRQLAYSPSLRRFGQVPSLLEQWKEVMILTIANGRDSVGFRARGELKRRRAVVGSREPPFIRPRQACISAIASLLEIDRFLSLRETTRFPGGLPCDTARDRDASAWKVYRLPDILAESWSLSRRLDMARLCRYCDAGRVTDREWSKLSAPFLRIPAISSRSPKSLLRFTAGRDIQPTNAGVGGMDS